MHGAMELFEFLSDFGGDRGIADVGVDLAAEGHADAHGLERAVIDIGGNDGAAASDFAAHEFGFDLFAAGDVLHLFGDDAQAGEVHLREITRTIGGGALRQALFYPGISDGHEVTPLFRLTHTLSHLLMDGTPLARGPKYRSLGDGRQQPYTQKHRTLPGERV